MDYHNREPNYRTDMAAVSTEVKGIGVYIDLNHTISFSEKHLWDSEWKNLNKCVIFYDIFLKETLWCLRGELTSEGKRKSSN